MSEQGFSKDPLTSSHGDSLVDQSFQSLKSKEVRDSLSPNQDLKFHSLALNNPNSSGWNVQSTAEVTPDGRGYRSETLATTDGIEKLNGGVAEFKGRNEHRSSGRQEGDDKNFVKEASESSNTHLQEHVVIGDENSGRVEKKSTTTSSSHSQYVSSSQTVDFDDGEPSSTSYITDSRHQKQFEEQQRQQQRLMEEQFHRQHEEKIHQQRHQEELQNRRMSEQSVNEEHHRHHQQQRLEKVETQNVQEQTRKVVNMDKASPEYQQHVEYLMSQPGEIISNTVEYPKPNVKMITTVKRLPDGTIVRNKRYETEELQPATETRRTSSASTTSKHQQQQQQTQSTQKTDRLVKNEENLHSRLQKTRERSSSPRKTVNVDAFDNSSVNKQLQEHSNYGEEVTHSYSSSKKSSHRFATESTSEVVEEYSDRSPSSVRKSSSKPQDFSTHGFPSVRPEKLTQEYPSEKPHGQRSPSGQEHFVVPHKKVEQTIGPNGEIIVKVSSETVKNVKHKSSSERVVETEIKESQPMQSYPSIHSGSPVKEAPYYQSPSEAHSPKHRSKSPDFSTQGFPSVRSPSKPHDSNMRLRSKSPDYSTQGFPSVRSPTTKPSGSHPGEEIVHKVSSEKVHKTNYKTNAEHVVETEINYNDYPQGREGTPSRPSQGYSTNGFPSVRSPTKAQPDFTTKGFPSVKPSSTSQTDSHSPKTHPVGGNRTPSSPSSSAGPKKPPTVETTQRLIHKEKETDAAHRAFAASLRSSSPVDSTRRDSTDHHTRQTPRSSISSTRTYRRDGREGSHDSNAPSESSRFSSTTVTRQSPAKTVGKTVTTKHSILKTSTKPMNGSSETVDLPQSPRSPKSPSPGKTVTTTTTKITTTGKRPSTTTTTTSSTTVKPGTK